MRALPLFRGSVPRILLPVLEIFRGSLLLRILLSILEIILGFCAAGSISAVSAAHIASVCSTKHHQILPVHSEYEEYRERLCTVSIVPSTRSFPHEPCTYAQQTKCSHGSGSFGVNCFRGGEHWRYWERLLHIARRARQTLSLLMPYISLLLIVQDRTAALRICFWFSMTNEGHWCMVHEGKDKTEAKATVQKGGEELKKACTSTPEQTDLNANDLLGISFMTSYTAPYVQQTDTYQVARTTEVSHTACKDEFRRNCQPPRGHLHPPPRCVRACKCAYSPCVLPSFLRFFFLFVYFFFFLLFLLLFSISILNVICFMFLVWVLYLSPRCRFLLRLV